MDILDLLKLKQVDDLKKASDREETLNLLVDTLSPLAGLKCKISGHAIQIEKGDGFVRMGFLQDSFLKFTYNFDSYSVESISCIQSSCTLAETIDFVVQYYASKIETFD